MTKFLKNQKLLFLLIGLIIFCSFSILHKFYVSVTQVEYREDLQSLQIISRLFIDDVELMLNNRYDKNITLVDQEDQQKVDELLIRYINDKLQFTIDGEEKSLKFIGRAYKDDLMLCYFEIEQVKSLKKIEVENKLLLDTFEEQQNILHVKKSGKRKSIIFQKDQVNGVLKFSK